MQRHLVFALLAALSLGFLAPLVDTVGELALVPVFVGILVRSVARGADAKFGHIWGWIYPEPKVTTTLDRLADRLVELCRPPGRMHHPVREVKVRTLDPFGD